jgi:beta-lactam-binding protein with PASTA domain
MKIFKLFFIFVLVIIISVGIFILAVTIFGKGSIVLTPQLIGRNLKDVQNSGFTIIVNLKKYNMKFPKGTIISQTPLPHSTIKKGHPIVVDISLGPKIETMPDFSSDLLQQVKLKIISLNFKVGDIEYIYSDKPPGTIIAQNPQPGSIYEQGKPVSLLVSKGKKKKALIIKDLIGLNYEDVIKVFKDLDYNVSIKKDYTLRYPVNSIIAQNPPPYSLIKDSLTLTVNKISSYESFVYLDYPYNGKLKIEKYVGDNLVYTNNIDYTGVYMDYFFDYRPFAIKLYLNGVLVKQTDATLIK